MIYHEAVITTQKNQSRATCKWKVHKYIGIFSKEIKIKYQCLVVTQPIWEQSA